MDARRSLNAAHSTPLTSSPREADAAPRTTDAARDKRSTLRHPAFAALTCGSFWG
jgi:hypothetical protein